MRKEIKRGAGIREISERKRERERDIMLFKKKNISMMDPRKSFELHSTFNSIKIHGRKIHIFLCDIFFQLNINF